MDPATLLIGGIVGWFLKWAVPIAYENRKERIQRMRKITIKTYKLVLACRQAKLNAIRKLGNCHPSEYIICVADQIHNCKDALYEYLYIEGNLYNYPDGQLKTILEEFFDVCSNPDTLMIVIITEAAKANKPITWNDVKIFNKQIDKILSKYDELRPLFKDALQ